MSKRLHCTRCGMRYKHVDDTTRDSGVEGYYWKKGGEWATRAPRGYWDYGCVWCVASSEEMAEEEEEEQDCSSNASAAQTLDKRVAEEERRKSEDWRNSAPWIR